MISVTRLNGENVTLNAELIETVESRPDTLITLTTGNRFMVKEKVEEIIKRVTEYRRSVNFLNRRDIRRMIAEEEE